MFIEQMTIAVENVQLLKSIKYQAVMKFCRKFVHAEHLLRDYFDLKVIFCSNRPSNGQRDRKDTLVLYIYFELKST